jgi:hypothetical protein
MPTPTPLLGSDGKAHDARSARSEHAKVAVHGGFLPILISRIATHRQGHPCPGSMAPRDREWTLMTYALRRPPSHPGRSSAIQPRRSSAKPPAWSRAEQTRLGPAVRQGTVGSLLLIERTLTPAVVWRKHRPRTEALAAVGPPPPAGRHHGAGLLRVSGFCGSVPVCSM